MQKSGRSSPRLEPQRIHNYFCELMRRQPGELNLSRERDFYALVGQFYVQPRAHEWFSSREFFTEKRKNKKEKDRKQRKKHYLRFLGRKRRSIYDRNLWELIRKLFTNHAAWIILRGEYRAMQGKCNDTKIERHLKACYHYLPQMKTDTWLGTLQGSETPFELALGDTADELGIARDTLRVMLAPSQAMRARPWWFSWVSLERQERLKILRRIPARERTRQDQALLHMTEAEFEPPSFSEETIARWRTGKIQKAVAQKTAKKP